MLKPYVVTIHDMTTLYHDRIESSLRSLSEAAAPSEATQRRTTLPK